MLSAADVPEVSPWSPTLYKHWGGDSLEHTWDRDFNQLSSTPNIWSQDAILSGSFKKQWRWGVSTHDTGMTRHCPTLCFWTEWLKWIFTPCTLFSQAGSLVYTVLTGRLHFPKIYHDDFFIYLNRWLKQPDVTSHLFYLKFLFSCM